MEVTAVYVEQVIIGLFVLVTLSFLFFGGPPYGPYELTEETTAIGLVALAYVVGILYDRIADSMLHSIAAWGKIAYGVFGRAPVLAKEHRYIDDDPIPEYELRLIATPPAQLYVLSRLRILRAMTSLLPAMTVAWTARLYAGPYLFSLVLIGYVVYAALAYWSPVPQTNHIEKVNAFLRRHVRVDEEGRMSVPGWRLVLLHPPVPCLLIATIVAAFRFEDHRTDIVNGALLTILTGWAWLRVADTHMRLVRAAVKHKVME